MGAQPVVIENCAIATMDGPGHDQAGAEFRSGHVTVAGDRITAVGEGPAADVPDGARRIDGTGCLATPGLVVPGAVHGRDRAVLDHDGFAADQLPR